MSSYSSYPQMKDLSQSHGMSNVTILVHPPTPQHSNAPSFACSSPDYSRLASSPAPKEVPQWAQRLATPEYEYPPVFEISRRNRIFMALVVCFMLFLGSHWFMNDFGSELALENFDRLK